MPLHTKSLVTSPLSESLLTVTPQSWMKPTWVGLPAESSGPTSQQEVARLSTRPIVTSHVSRNHNTLRHVLYGNIAEMGGVLGGSVRKVNVGYLKYQRRWNLTVTSCVSTEFCNFGPLPPIYRQIQCPSVCLFVLTPSVCQFVLTPFVIHITFHIIITVNTTQGHTTTLHSVSLWLTLSHFHLTLVSLFCFHGPTLSPNYPI